jgi:hypothetical protein
MKLKKEIIEKIRATRELCVYFMCRMRRSEATLYKIPAAAVLREPLWFSVLAV